MGTMDDLKRYVVVEFTETAEISTVLKTWLGDPNHCFWPGTYSRKLLVNLDPPDEEWELWDIKILGSSDDLKEALAKERKAKQKSDLNFELETQRGKRKQLKPSELPPETEESSDEYVTPDYIISVSVKGKSRNECNKHVNKKNKHMDGASKSAKSSHSNNPETDSLKSLEAILSDTPESDQLKSLEAMLSSESDQMILEEESLQTHVSNKPRMKQTQGCSNSSCDDSLKQLRGRIENVEKTVLQIKSDVEEILALMTNLTKKIVPCDPLIKSEFEKSLPLETVEDLMELEESLKDEEEQKEVINFLKQVGGVTVEEATKRILVRLFTNELATKYSWEGKKGNRVLKNFTIIKLIDRVLATGPLKNTYSSDVFEKKVKVWLSQASRRQFLENSRKKSRSEEKDCSVTNID